jgi:hypothetical protein
VFGRCFIFCWLDAASEIRELWVMQKGPGGGGEAFLGWLSDCQSLKKDTAT